MQPISGTTKDVGAELLSDAKNVSSAAANRLYSEADARKSDAVNQVQAVSSTLERAAQGLDANAPSWLKSALEQGADQVKSFAETLDQNDSHQMVAQIGEFAKRSPVAFLGACSVAGFAAARIFKAGGNANSTSQMGSVSPTEPAPLSPQNMETTNDNIGSTNANGELL